jgi:predicted nucleic acid-binding protein
MKLIDSSAWIEYYRKEGKKEYKDSISSAIRSNAAAVNGVIQLEILVFTKTESEYNSIYSDFHAFHYLELNEKVFQKASEMGFNLRRKGITIPSTDLIIAANAIVTESQLIHFDKHYTYIAEHYPLKLVNDEKNHIL